jgi:quinol monooxygenase YgiN
VAPVAEDVRVVALISTQPGRGEALRERFEALAPQVRAEDGCLAYDLHRVVDDPDRIAVIERWASRAALAAHAEAPHMLAYRADVTDWLAAPTQVVVLEPEPVV